jgi:hypothetical protein
MGSLVSQFNYRYTTCLSTSHNCINHNFWIIQVFNDFGPAFTVVDVDGNQPLSAMIASVGKEEKGVVACLDETRHGFETGDFVK